MTKPYLTVKLRDGRAVDIELTYAAAEMLLEHEPGSPSAGLIIADILREWRADGCPGIPYLPIGVEAARRPRATTVGPQNTATIEMPDAADIIVPIDADLTREISALELRESAIDEDTPIMEIYELADARRAIEEEIGRRYARSRGLNPSIGE